MRPLALLTAAALIGSALVAAPLGAAQAADPDLYVAWDASIPGFRLAALPGLTAFAEGEELMLSGGDETIEVTLMEGDHVLSFGQGCAPAFVGATQQGVCTAPKSAAKTRMIIDMRAASVATTTAVAEATSTTDPLSITFYGGTGPDYVQGGAGDDEISGGAGEDNIYGGPGADKLVGDDGADDIWGEEGSDSIAGGRDDDFLIGDGETITGGEGLDSITGGPGVDTLDSQDGLPDTYVNCDNEPGKGAITFDRTLDIPYDCPVVLAPTVPLKFEASGGRDSITVSWAPPVFDGNATQLTYELTNRPPGESVNVPKPIVIDGSESSYTLGNLATPGLYFVSLRARNEVGASVATPTIPVAIGGTPSPPQSVASVFERRWSARVSWVPPGEAEGVTYELALRVMDKARKTWLAWTTLPDIVRGTSLSVGDDLRIVRGRVYQFRVRTVTANGDVSAWVTSPARFADDLAPLEGLKLTGRGPVSVSVTAPGPAWKLNVDKSALTVSMTTQSYQAMPMVVVSTMVRPTFERYSGEFPGPLTLTSGCWVGLNYRLPGSTKVERVRADIDCPS
jgi:hypothetical protein